MQAIQSEAVKVQCVSGRRCVGGWGWRGGRRFCRRWVVPGCCATRSWGPSPSTACPASTASSSNSGGGSRSRARGRHSRACHARRGKRHADVVGRHLLRTDAPAPARTRAAVRPGARPPGPDRPDRPGGRSVVRPFGDAQRRVPMQRMGVGSGGDRLAFGSPSSWAFVGRTPHGGATARGRSSRHAGAGPARSGSRNCSQGPPIAGELPDQRRDYGPSVGICGGQPAWSGTGVPVARHRQAPAHRTCRELDIIMGLEVPCMSASNRTIETSQAFSEPRHAPAPAADATVSVVIPALNEAANLPHVLAASRDRRRGDPRRRPFDRRHRRGRARDPPGRPRRPAGRPRQGQRAGLRLRRGAGDIIVMLDADGSTDPAEIPRFVAALLDGRDFAKGSRFAAAAGSSDITRLRRVGNRALGAARQRPLPHPLHRPLLRLQRVLAPLPAAHERDLRRLRGRDADQRADRARGPVVTEVPSVEHARLHGESKLRVVRDGLRVLRTILARARSPSVPSGRASAPGLPRDPGRSPGRRARRARGADRISLSRALPPRAGIAARHAPTRWRHPDR